MQNIPDVSIHPGYFLFAGLHIRTSSGRIDLMDSGNLVLLILGIGLIALIAYLIYKNRAIKGRFQVGPISAELESDKSIETTAQPAPNPTTMPAVDMAHAPIKNIAASRRAAATITIEHPGHDAAGAAQVQASIQQFMTPNGGFNSKALRDFIATRFNLEEMATLAADTEIDFDSIPGQGKEAKARELVQFCERRGKLALLAAAVIDARG